VVNAPAATRFDLVLRGSLARIRFLPVEPSACGGCGGELTGTPGQVSASVQVSDGRSAIT
jgi:hypothetical protein